MRHSERWVYTPTHVLSKAASLDDVDLTPTEAMRAAAMRGLDLRQKAPKSGKGGLDTKQAGQQGIGSGVARARDILSGKALSEKVVRQMHAFFSRHAAFKHKHKEGPEGKAIQSWLLWGGDAGEAWSKRKVDEMNKLRDSETIEKAARSVKYKHRKFGGYDSKGRKRWIYYYDDPKKNKAKNRSELHFLADYLQVGDTFKSGNNHISVVGFEGSRVLYKDVDGSKKSVDGELFQTRLINEHQSSIEAEIANGYKKRKAVSDAAEKYGSEKQKARAKALVNEWLDAHNLDESSMREHGAKAEEAPKVEEAPKAEEVAPVPEAKKEKKPKKQVAPKTEAAHQVEVSATETAPKAEYPPPIPQVPPRSEVPPLEQSKQGFLDAFLAGDEAEKQKHMMDILQDPNGLQILLDLSDKMISLRAKKEGGDDLPIPKPPSLVKEGSPNKEAIKEREKTVSDALSGRAFVDFYPKTPPQAWQEVTALRSLQNHPFYQKYADRVQDTWDRFGIVLVPPMTKEYKGVRMEKEAAVDESFFSKITEELEQVNKLFDLKKAVQKHGIVMEMPRPEKGTSFSVRAVAYASQNRIGVFPTGDGFSVLHELVHILDFHAAKEKEQAKVLQDGGIVNSRVFRSNLDKKTKAQIEMLKNYKGIVDPQTQETVRQIETKIKTGMATNPERVWLKKAKQYLEDLRGSLNEKSVAAVDTFEEYLDSNHEILARAFQQLGASFSEASSKTYNTLPGYWSSKQMRTNFPVLKDLAASLGLQMRKDYIQAAEKDPAAVIKALRAMRRVKLNPSLLLPSTSSDRGDCQ